MRVLLFDIDGTLITSAGAGGRALERAFERLLGWPRALAGVELAGHTDRGIVRDAMRLRGASAEEAEAAIAPVLELYVELLAEELAARRGGGPLPGVEALLARLAGEEGALVGLLTGNIAAGAERKLRAFGLWDRFRFGAFGCDAEARPDLLPVALGRAAAQAGRAFAPAEAVVIGDTPRDVAVARAHEGARCLAVATGRYDPDALRACGADLVLPDLADTEGALAFLLGGRGGGGASPSRGDDPGNASGGVVEHRGGARPAGAAP